MFSFAYGHLLCLFLFWLLPINKWSRWPFVLCERRGKCSFSTDLHKLSCSSFQSSSYREPPQTSTLQNRDKAAVHSRLLLSPDRNFASDPWEVLRSLFRVIGRLCKSRSFPAGWMMLQSFRVPFQYLLIRFLVEGDLLPSKEREGACFFLWDLSPLEIYYFLSLIRILFSSSSDAFITYFKNSCHPLFLFVLVFISLIWG